MLFTIVCPDIFQILFQGWSLWSLFFISTLLFTFIFPLYCEHPHNTRESNWMQKIVLIVMNWISSHSKFEGILSRKIGNKSFFFVLFYLGIVFDKSKWILCIFVVSVKHLLKTSYTFDNMNYRISSQWLHTSLIASSYHYPYC